VPSPASRRGLATLRRLIDELGVQRVIVGLPLSLSGADSDQTREARSCSDRLADEVSIPIELYDERLTTRLAARTGGRASEDSRAAAHLLEGWLASTQVARQADRHDV
jgi:putative Holliday junction resolvase